MICATIKLPETKGVKKMNFTMDQPPKPTGNIPEDISELYSYLEELVDELEYLFSEVNNE